MTISNDTSQKIVDILVIGAGASGGAAAAWLAEAGFSVKCLEQGYWQDPSKYASASKDYEFEMLTNWAPDPNVRQRDEDYPVNDSNSPITPVMFNGVGGSTILWTAHTPRFHPSDFRVKTLDGVADDWPISYDELDEFYDLNDEVMGCSGINGDPANPPRSPRQMPPLPLGKDGKKLISGFEKLGWHWWPSDSYVNSQRYGEERDACNFCGHNHMGCYQRAKSSTDLTYWPRALRSGATIETGARVRRVTTDELGRVTGAEYVDSKGNERRQRARAVIMAANGIGTPRLLLNSVSTAHAEGLANSSGLVGKNLMFHPFAMISGTFPEKMNTWQGPLGNIAMSQEFYETDKSRGFVRGYTYQFQRSLGPAWIANGGFRDPVPWGKGHHDELEKRLGSVMAIAVIGEDLPEEHNTVELDPELTDSDGIPTPRLNYTLSKNSRDQLDHAIENAKKALKAAGADDIYVDPMMRQSGWHLMGTARMGNDPTRSVVNKWGQSHDVDNLFIVDGSVFVTGAAVNPTPTIQALALRTADYIVSNRQDIKG
ncbi:MAG: GMC family oxidoreductase [Chloroflexi bacterium]|nr:GMC family oxidoreductase [Chloroflexota bacterium]